MLECFFLFILGILTLTDIRERRIPNWILLWAIIGRIIYYLLEQKPFWIWIMELMGNGLAISAPLYFLTLGLDNLLGKQTLGGGDIKLIFVTGIYLGFDKNLLMLFIAGILALIFCWIRKEKELPFGPAIAIASVVVMCFTRI